MKRKLTYLILAAASLLMTACHIYDDYMYGPDGEQKVKVSFVLALGSSDDPFTKAETWSPNTPDGTVGYDPKNLGGLADNAISDLKVVFYTAQTDDYYAKVNITGWEKIVGQNDSENTNLYRFSGDMWVEEEDLDDEFKMMVFVNVENQIYPGTKLSELEFTAENNDYIPMWGVKTVTLNQMKESDITVYVLRAMAKVVVKLGTSPKNDGYTIKSLTMNNVNTKGYLLPQGSFDRPGLVESTESLSLSGLRALPSHASSHAVTADFQAKADSLVMYVPEYDNISDASMAANMNLELYKGEGTEYAPSSTIEFKNYVDGQPSGSAYDICRNHKYLFEINKIVVEETGLKFIVDIEDLELGGRYGFEY
ncbi:MAG: hypothetical protein IKV91_04610 [Bacteroidales bacterium]|nr:hypothetical protein [Bacteroidales bacterium]